MTTLKLVPTHGCTICRILVRVLPPSGKNREKRVYEAVSGKKHRHNNEQVLIPLPPDYTAKSPDLDLEDWGKYG